MTYSKVGSPQVGKMVRVRGRLKSPQEMDDISTAIENILGPTFVVEMRKFNKPFLISICLFLSFLVPSCEKVVVAPPPPDSSDALEPVSQKLKARIYIDATVSMEGFVVPGSSTNYAQILQPLESAVVSGWPDGKVEFYQFGTEVLPIRFKLRL